MQALARRTNTTLVLVLMSGSAVAAPWAAASERVGAIVQHFYAGALGGVALADVLFGATPPSGRLPVMVPASEAQLPRARAEMSAWRDVRPTYESQQALRAEVSSEAERGETAKLELEALRHAQASIH